MPLLECVSVILRSDDAPPLEVEGYTLRGAPGLAVTPARTGIETTSATYYCVTHTDSGMRIGDQYAPFDAVNLMAELHTLDIDWTLPREAFNRDSVIPRRAVNEIVNRYETAGDDED